MTIGIRLLFFLFVLAPLPAWSQPSVPKAEQPPKVERVVDPLGRDTPRGTILGFIRAANQGNFAKAAQFLELGSNINSKYAVELARQLDAVINEGFHTPVGTISNRPEGALDDGLPPDQEIAGTIHLEKASRDVELLLVRRTSNGTIPIWLISADTLQSIPALYQEIGFPGIENVLPQFLVDTEPAGAALWKWIAAVLLLPLSAVFAWGFTKLVAFLIALFSQDKAKRKWDDYWEFVRVPTLLIITLVTHVSVITRLGLPLLYRFYYSRAAIVLLLLIGAWWLWRLIDVAAESAQRRASTYGYVAANSFLLLGRRVLKSVLLFAVLIAVVGALGLDTTTALAGLGIGGIAVALAAQKSLENFIGGVTLIADNALRVGEGCLIGDRFCLVEDISLRSTVFRTLEGTRLSIPNGTLATMNIENLFDRQKTLFRQSVQLRYETSPDQVRDILVELRRMVYSHPRLDQDSSRVRLLNIGPASIQIEIFTIVLTGNAPEFLAIGEDILLKALEIIRASGAALGGPSQVLYVKPDTGFDKAKTVASEQRIEDARTSGELPFPDFPPEAKAALRESALQKAAGESASD
jgi:MscS family membrane protein